VVKLPTIARCEKVLGLPAEKWKGQCYGISCALVEKGLVEGAAVYGHWLGPVAKGSFFVNKKDAPFIQHGWVLCPDGSIVDATRWVFENVAPYIHHARSDRYYDEGGNSFRETFRGAPPVFDPTDKMYNFSERDFDDETWDFILGLLRADPANQREYTLSRPQLFYLGNTSPARLGMYLPNVYRALIRNGNEAIIPMDNLSMYERTHAASAPKKQGAVRKSVQRTGRSRRRA
jgi:hypothetical protein